MTSPVTIEWGGGTFRARDGAGAATEGLSLGEAVARLEAETGPPSPPRVIAPLPPLAPGEHPFAAMAGSLKDHPLFDDYVRAIEEYRRGVDDAEGDS